MKRFLYVLVIVALACLIHPAHSWAYYSGQYMVTTTDTPSVIDTANTTAVVDTNEYAIYLPKQSMAHQIAMWPGKKDLLALTNGKVIHYSFTGSSYQENTVLDVGVPSNSLALAAPTPFPDVVVSSPDKLHHYSFTGSGLVDNPYLAVQGLANVTSVGTSGTDVAGLVNNQVKHYSFTGSQMTENTFLEPGVQLASPVDLALFPDNNDLVVLTNTKLYFYNYNGSTLAENPALEVTGLSNAVGMSYTDQSGGHEVAVIQGNQVKDYMFTGGSMQYNAALSVTSGLTSPTSVVIVPGTEDRIIVDGDQVKYYQWNGSSMVYDSALSLTVSGLIQPGYNSQAQAQSQIFNSGEADNVARVLAYVNAPTNTEVDAFATVDGSTWVELFKVVGNAAGGETYATYDNGNSFQDMGSASVAYPGSANQNLWINMPTGVSGSQVGWRFVLSTADSKVTPMIQVQPPGTPGTTPVITWEFDIAPTTPVVVTQGSCYTTSTPGIQWQPAIQSTWSFRVKVYAQGSGSLVYDSGVLPYTALTSNSPNDTYDIPTSTDPATPGPLWASGTWQFEATVQVYNDHGIPSQASAQGSFCVLAFDRPRIDQLTAPSTGQAAPNATDQTTWLMITRGEASSSLASTMAGGDVQMAVDWIGPASPGVSVTFPYPEPNPTQNASVMGSEPTSASNLTGFGGGAYDGYTWTNGTNDVYVVDFWTDPSESVTPDGTVVGMDWLGNAGSNGSAMLNAPSWADGVVRTSGTVLGEYQVLLNPGDNR